MQHKQLVYECRNAVYNYVNGNMQKVTHQKAKNFKQRYSSFKTAL